MTDINAMNMRSIVTNLIDNGFQILTANYRDGVVTAVGNGGENVVVSIQPAAYCKVIVDNHTVSNMAQPYNVGECARLKRHVGMFENVTMDTKV